MIVALDFDGTLVTHAWPEIGEDIGAFSWLIEFQKLYPSLRYILWTVRSDEPLIGAMDYCKSRGLYFWAVNANPEQRHWSPSNKAHAHVYVDDAALGAPLIYPNSDRPYVDWGVMGPLLRHRIADYFNAQRG